ncbi:MAG TPA: hypothetical protein VHM48_02725 [Candidatus Limnocylindrales bacterium]|nr:hypothetical protein [Candidatus Limnocylindrales bacterium]
MIRPLLAYAAVVAIGVVAWVALGGSRADIVASIVLLGLVTTPGFVLSVELVRRFAPTSWPSRALVGAASWAGWWLVVAVIATVLSRVVLLPGELTRVDAIAAAAGALFSVLAFDGRKRRPGMVLIGLALAVTALIVVGAVWMAGRWGGAV